MQEPAAPGRRIRIWLRRNLSDRGALAVALALCAASFGLALWLPGGPYGSGIGVTLGIAVGILVQFVLSRGRKPLFPEEEPVRSRRYRLLNAAAAPLAVALVGLGLVLFPWPTLSVLPVSAAVSAAARFRDGPTARHDAASTARRV